MNKEVKPTWNYILNDLALYSLFMRVAYSEDVPKQDKIDLEHQIKLLQAKVNQLETSIATKDMEIGQLNNELLQLKSECYKKRNDNKSLRGTIKSVLETSNNRHNEIKRLLVKIEKLETEVDSTNSKVSELANRIIDAIGYIRYCQINEKDIFPVIEAQKMMEILEGGSNE